LLGLSAQLGWKKGVHTANEGLTLLVPTRYDIGFGGQWELVYVLKRVTKGKIHLQHVQHVTSEVFNKRNLMAGWVYRCYPGPYKVYLETPDCKDILIKEYPQGVKPRLTEVSALLREQSQQRFGIFNDRYMQGRI
jgi:hypothetical protein